MRYKLCGAFAVILLTAHPTVAAPSSSANYTAPPGLFVDAGGQSSSADYQQYDVSGDAYPQTGSASANYQGGLSVSALMPALNLVKGWNLAGNSVNVPLDVATVFDAGVSTVWKWEASGTNPKVTYPAWAFYTPTLSASDLDAYAASKGYDVLTAINGGEGYWVNANATFSVRMPAGTAVRSKYFADQPAPPNVLPKGWSLIAVEDNPTPRNFANAIALTQPAPVAATSLVTLWAWDSASTNWYFYAPNLDNNGTLASYISGKSYEDFTAEGKTLDPTTGFWVNHP